MILKEKFAETILVPLENQGFYIDWDKVEKCEKIADDYAIEFIEWYFYYTPENIVTSKELLEIFKKEKGL